MALPSVATIGRGRQQVACRICGSCNQTTYLTARGYQIVRCADCSLWYVNPQPTPEELSEFYALYDDGDQWRFREHGFNQGVRKAISRFATTGKLLDVGCGSGDFLACMRGAGFTVQGIEPSETGAAYARNTLGVEVFSGMLESYLKSSDRTTFNVVSLLNVLEHLLDPQAMLRELRELMEQNALLVVVVPDARFHDYVGKLRAFLGKPDPYWLEPPKGALSGFKLPDHLSSFQPQTIAALLRRCNFEILRIENAPIVLNPGVYRNFSKIFVRSLGQLMYHLSLHRFVFGYSTLAIARMKDDKSG